MQTSARVPADGDEYNNDHTTQLQNLWQLDESNVYLIYICTKLVNPGVLDDIICPTIIKLMGKVYYDQQC